ncbi:uncharacterized protein IL334_003581 [Kwoniella shivajii]|uniref:Ricin B lectin domain-containing protein n=1 Tax=Kwoniella shivajii TaxID=564305 RepID=A0ABZ1CXZ6_9TREE|nr:hypothetical protein IL334_003581 [Kwoniella shivajii]
MFVFISALTILAALSSTSAATITGVIKDVGVEGGQCIGSDSGGLNVHDATKGLLNMVDCVGAPKWQVDTGDQGGYVLLSPNLTTALLVTDLLYINVGDSSPGDERQQYVLSLSPTP